MRTLLLLRHAKSDYPQGVPDRERPLSARGERDAVAAGEWLGAAYPLIDEAVVSPARRAQETWARVSRSVTSRVTHVDDRVYDDWGSRLPEICAAMNTYTHTALIVGHNPGIEDFARALAAGGDPVAIARMREKYPTSGIAVVHFMGAWHELQRSSLVAFAVPRG